MDPYEILLILPQDFTLTKHLQICTSPTDVSDAYIYAEVFLLRELQKEVQILRSSVQQDCQPAHWE